MDAGHDPPRTIQAFTPTVRRGGGYRIGVDLDNTIVDYDEIFHSVALERLLIEPEVTQSKKHVRDRLRRRPNGDLDWQSVQALVYGPLMHEARAVAGVRDFFLRCRGRGVPVKVVSHKSEYARLDETRTSLRQAALEWLAAKGFFDDPIGLGPQDVHFEPTRLAKLKRIERLGCTHFVDDLEETFAEPAFPRGTVKILYRRHLGEPPPRDVRMFGTWQEISDGLFGASD